MLDGDALVPIGRADRRSFAVAHATRAQGCQIDLSGAAAREWLDAAAAVSVAGLSAGDCISVRVELSEQSARVLFTTPDGRVAERHVAAPMELKPTIDALRVQAPTPAPAAPTEPGSAASADQPSPAPPASERPAVTASSDVHIALLAGMRGGADSLISPMLSGALSIVGKHWELGAGVTAEVQYADATGERPADRQGSAAAIGLHGGLREPIGPFDLLAGGRVALGVLLSRDHESLACTGPSDAICRLGSEDERYNRVALRWYAGFAVPSRSTVRLRNQVGADVVTPVAGAGTLPLTPSWALLGLVGLELAL